MNISNNKSMLTILALALVIATVSDAAAPKPANFVLKAESFRQMIEDFNKNDHELYRGYYPNTAAWDFLEDNIPLLDCPDKDIQTTYYFRWWTYRKHIKQTPDGFIVDEFLPQVGWAGKYNSINCAAGHHLYEGRWLKAPNYMDDYSIFWFRKGGEERGKDYNHSTYCDLVISGLVGLRPRPDETVEVNPLVPQGWASFCLDQVPYHGHLLTILWDQTGQRYHKGKGLRVFAAGKEIASSPVIGRLTGHL